MSTTTIIGHKFLDFNRGKSVHLTFHSMWKSQRVSGVFRLSCFPYKLHPIPCLDRCFRTSREKSNQFKIITQINCIYQKSSSIGAKPIRKSKLPSPQLFFNVSRIFFGVIVGAIDIEWNGTKKSSKLWRIRNTDFNASSAVML